MLYRLKSLPVVQGLQRPTMTFAVTILSNLIDILSYMIVCFHSPSSVSRTRRLRVVVLEFTQDSNRRAGSQ